ncbi:unnamed protein product [marine sediment metagenome]|uniref:Uncharacterized protein n=1 Tax=marine sediment metagenome TaxID=412755 RepID=X0WNF5_9ZZZZ
MKDIRLNVMIEKAKYQKFKIWCINNETTISKFVSSKIDEVLDD